jgi:hypothetical protein
MTQIEEYQKALKEKRQPLCVNCDKPLDIVEQVQTELIRWTWDADKKRYLKKYSEGGSEGQPVHQGCDMGDWDFVEIPEAHDLGLG